MLRVAVFPILVMSLCTVSAGAESSEAQNLAQRAIALRRARKNAEALALLNKAYALEPTPRLLAHIGLAEQALGLWIDAETHVKQALQETGDPWIARNYKSIEEALKVIDAHLGWLEVETHADNAEVWINETRIDWPRAQPVRVLAGSALIEVRAPNHLPATRTAFVPPKARMHETVEPIAVPSQPKPPEPSAKVDDAAPRVSQPKEPSTQPAESGPSTRRVLGYSVGALGIIGVGTAGYLTLHALRLKNQRNEHCIAGECDDIAYDLDDDARRSANAATICAGVGVAALVAGTWLALSSSPKAKPSKAITWEIEPRITTTWASIGIRGAW